MFHVNLPGRIHGDAGGGFNPFQKSMMMVVR